MEKQTHKDIQSPVNNQKDPKHPQSDNSLDDLDELAYIDDLDQFQMQQIIDDEQDFIQRIKDMSDLATIKINKGMQEEALIHLQQGERVLEFAAQCGKSIDRNLIIVILYNIACCFQGLWELERCKKYIDAVIYNLEVSLKEEESLSQIHFSSKKSPKEDQLTYQVKRSTFLVRTYLQYCAVLSQLGQHNKAQEIALRGTETSKKIFRLCNSFVQENYKQSDSDSSQLTSKSDSHQINLKNHVNSSQEKTQYIKEQISFQNLVLEQSLPILSDIVQIEDINFQDKQSEKIKIEAKKQFYFWKNNPENNEKHIRQSMNSDKKMEKDEDRNLLGISNLENWIQNLNIGTIMHLQPVKMDEFCYFGDIHYEISKQQLLSKVIYLSVSYFTVATEIRFAELEIQKKNEIKKNTCLHKLDEVKQTQLNEKDVKDFLKQPKSEQYNKSEIYHLKAIEIVCKYIKTSSAFITHLIQSFQKHYNTDLSSIEEEASIISHGSILESMPTQNLPQAQLRSNLRRNNFQVEKYYKDKKKQKELISQTMEVEGSSLEDPLKKQSNNFLIKEKISEQNKKINQSSNKLEKQDNFALDVDNFKQSNLQSQKKLFQNQQNDNKNQKYEELKQKILSEKNLHINSLKLNNLETKQQSDEQQQKLNFLLSYKQKTQSATRKDLTPNNINKQIIAELNSKSLQKIRKCGNSQENIRRNYEQFKKILKVPKSANNQSSYKKSKQELVIFPDKIHQSNVISSTIISPNNKMGYQTNQINRLKTFSNYSSQLKNQKGNEIMRDIFSVHQTNKDEQDIRKSQVKEKQIGLQLLNSQSMQRLNIDPQKLRDTVNKYI